MTGLKIGVFTGEDIQATRRLVSHGLLWLLVVSLLDLGTSWLMMSLWGPNAEAYAPQRALFQNPSPQTVLGLAYGQSSYFEFGLLGIAALVSLKLKEMWQKEMKRAIALSASSILCPLSIIFTWFLSFFRYVEGVGSNTIGILIKANVWVQVVIGLVVVVGGALLITRDLTSSMRGRSLMDRPSAGSPLVIALRWEQD